MNQGIMALASAGRGEDTRLAHLMQGEVVVPPHILRRNKNLKKALERHLAKTGTNLSDITVGSGTSSINPNTGLEEFGFLSKLWKKVKKVIDPVAQVARFIPGPWQAPANIYVKGKAALNVVKGEGGIGDLATIFSGQKIGDLFANLGKSTVDIGNFFSDPLGNLQKFGGYVKEYIFKGEDDVGLFGNLQKSATDFFSGDPNYNPETGKGQSRLGMIEDFFKGQSGEGLGNFVDSVTGRVRGAGIDPSFAAMATAYGLATKKALEKQIGGMGDIRDSLRQDLKRATPYGSGGFDLGFAEGGEVMDMRDGGESIGPGTGTSDDIPAMLSDGEFVMTAKANLGAGSVGLKKGKGGIMQLIPQGEPDRERGADNMMTLMRYFEARA